MSQDCLFCRIIKGEIDAHVVYEDDEVFAFLDIGPVSKGHTLFIPKEHAKDLTSGSEVAAAALMKAVHSAAPEMMHALGASGYNLGMNQGEDAGQIIFHTHLHVIPRYQGQERTFEKQSPSQEELAAVADQIRQKTGYGA